MNNWKRVSPSFSDRITDLWPPFRIRITLPQQCMLIEKFKLIVEYSPLYYTSNERDVSWNSPNYCGIRIYRIARLKCKNFCIPCLLWMWPLFSCFQFCDKIRRCKEMVPPAFWDYNIIWKISHKSYCEIVAIVYHNDYCIFMNFENNERKNIFSSESTYSPLWIHFNTHKVLAWNI